MRITSFLIIAWLGAWFAAAESIADDVPKNEGELRATLERLLRGMAAKDLPAREWPQHIWQETCFKLGAPGNEAGRAAACKVMCEKLGPATPAPARIWLLKQLERIGRGESVGAVAAVLDDGQPLVREAARCALLNNPAPEAVARLRAKLASAKDTLFKVGLINALGTRGDAAAVAALAGELGNADAAIALAAAHALGSIDKPEAAAALTAARSNTKGDLRRVIDDSLLLVADRLASQGKIQQAVDFYMNLFEQQEPRPIRMAALKGLLSPPGDLAADIILEVLPGNDADFNSVALGYVRHCTPETVAKLAAGLAKLPPAGQAALATVLGSRRCKEAMPAILKAAASPDEQVKTAALEALGGVGDVSVAPLLMEATFAGGKPGAAARHALETIFAPGVDEWLIEKMKNSSDLAQRRLLIEILDRRMAAAAVPALLADASHKDAATRHAAMTALSHLAGPADVAAMIRAMLKLENSAEREEAERQITLVCTRIAGQDNQPRPVLAVFDAAGQAEKDALLPLLGRIGGARVRQLINDALASGDAHWREAGFTAICNWPESSVSEDILKLAEGAKDKEHRIRAIRAFARVVAMRGDGTPAEVKLPMLKRAMALADRDEERDMLIGRAVAIYHVDTLRFVAPYLDNPKLAQQTCWTVVQLSHHDEIRRPNRDEFNRALDKVIKICNNPYLVNQAKENRAKQ